MISHFLYNAYIFYVLLCESSSFHLFHKYCIQYTTFQKCTFSMTGHDTLARPPQKTYENKLKIIQFDDITHP